VSSPVRDGHPDPEELDLLLDDDPDVAGEVRAHVEGCDRCSEVLADLTRVRGLLHAEAGRTPPPPPDLDERIAAALAEAARSWSAPESAPAASSGGAETVVPLRRRSTVPRWVALAAGLVVLAGAGGTATQLRGPGNGASSLATSGADAEAGAAAPEAAAQAPVLATGTDYEPADLVGQVDALLAAAKDDGGRPGPAASSLSAPGLSPQGDAGQDAAGSPLTDPAALAGCLQALGAGSTTPLAVDLATWQGRPAAVLLLPDARAGRTQVWVVSPTCRPGADGLLHYQVVQR
jgi:hypothetical protein